MTLVCAAGRPPCRKRPLRELACLGRLLLVTLIGALLAAGWARAEGQGARLGASLPGHAALVDQAQLLSETERRELTARLAEVEALRGVRMGIVLVGSTGEDSIESYANELGNAWHIGDAGGVLIVVAVQDRHARIEVSRAVEGRLPDVVAGRILRDTMMPAFKAQRYHDGLLDSVRRVDQALLVAPSEPVASGPDLAASASGAVAEGHLAGWVAIALMLLWLIVLVYCVILFVRNRLTMRTAAGVAGGKALIEAGLFSTVMSVPSSVTVALLSGIGVWLILLVASGVRRLFGGGARRDPEAGQARRKPSKPARRPSEKRQAGRQRGRKAGLVANERRRQTEDSRSFWSSSSTSSDSSCSSDSNESSSSNDFGGGGASSSW